MNFLHVTEFLIALHLISVITWSAGILYLARLFVYHRALQEGKDIFMQKFLHENKMELAESAKHMDQQRFSLMERRLYFGIATPSMIVALITGLYVGIVTDQLATAWLGIKMMLVIFLTAYHITLWMLLKRLFSKTLKLSSLFLRLYNELSIVLIVYIVFLASFKAVSPALLYGSMLILVVVFLFFGIRFFSAKKGDGKSK